MNLGSFWKWCRNFDDLLPNRTSNFVRASYNHITRYELIIVAPRETLTKKPNTIFALAATDIVEAATAIQETPNKEFVTLQLILVLIVRLLYSRPDSALEVGQRGLNDGVAPLISY